tara:strand:- start:10376 stop:11314 length:939 start_codon:yes stop_codon:yes gene_type:complete
MFNHDVCNFQVRKVPLYINHMFIGENGTLDRAVHAYKPFDSREYGEVPRSIGVGIEKDDGTMLGIVSDAYEVVQYNDIVEQVEEALSISGIDTTDANFDTNVYNGGAQLELRARFPAHEQTIDGRGDTVIPEFCFRTSHDRTWANNGMMGLWRAMCYNTLVSGDKLAYIYGRHTKNFNVPAFAAKIRGAAEYVASDGMDKMRAWYNTPVQREQAIDLFTKTLASRMDNVKREKVANKVMLSNLMKVFDEENRHILGQGAYEGYGKRDAGTLWTAYQAATYWSTHVDKPASKAIREDKVRKMLASDAWGQLAA